MGRRNALYCLLAGALALAGCLQSPTPAETVEPPAEDARGCTSPAECPVGRQCIDNSCVQPPPCETNGDCPGDRTCVRGGCYTDPDDIPDPDVADGGETYGFDIEVGRPELDVSRDTDFDGGRVDADTSGSSVEQNCKDGIDNDGNGDRDCNDPACFGEICSDQGEICLPTSQNRCACPDSGETETSCGDGIDNDCDGDIDCADVDCAKRDCDSDRPKKRCEYVSKSCELPSGEANCSSGEYCCGDGMDNDDDGTTDCADSDCHGEQCGSGKWCRKSSMFSDYECQ